MATQHQPPAFIRLPDKLLAALAGGQQRQDALSAEAASITQQASSIATAYLMGVGVDTDRDHYRIDLAAGGMRLVGSPALAAVPDPEPVIDQTHIDANAAD